MKLQIKRLKDTAKIPVYAHDNDAGMDLFAAAAISIPPGGRVQVQTGIAVAIPEGYVGLIWDKSGISHKIGLKTMGGVIDSSYRGEILIGLINHGEQSHTFEVGDKITQMLIQKVEHPEFEEVNDLDETVRGTSGIGSTGK